MIDVNFLNNYFKFYDNLKFFIKFVKILGLVVDTFFHLLKIQLWIFI
jgi:hypothetical protein